MIDVQILQRFACMENVSVLKNHYVFAVTVSHAKMKPAPLSPHHHLVREIKTVCLHFTVIP
jgi:hypothetical protein